MDPATIATITGLAGAAKATIDTVRAVLEKAKGRNAEKATREALGLVDGLQARVFELQEIAFRLHQEKVQALKEKQEALEENTQLRKQIRAKEEGATDRERYELRRVGKSTVRVAKDDPDTYLCATCFEAGTKVYLTETSRDFRAEGTHYCPTCMGFVGAR